MNHHVLFKTIHGSRLYGLHHENSDFDYYTVVDKVKTRKAKYAKHKIAGELDSTVVDFGTFVDLATKGVPQALEAMFSQQAEVDEISEFRNNFYVGTDQVLDRYLRTMKSFAFWEDETIKHKRHALRLALAVKSMRKTGRFNPTLTRIEVELITSLASLSSENVYNDALVIAWS